MGDEKEKEKLVFVCIHGIYTFLVCGGGVDFFSVSLKSKKYTCKSILPLLPQNCYRRFYHAFIFSLSMVFYVMEEKTSKSNILLVFFSFLCRGYIVGFISHSNEVRVGGISAI